MIKLLTKIEQDYGLPVAISFAKQAIKQNLSRTSTLKRNDKTEEFTSGVISALLTWKKTDEGGQFWRDMYHRYAGIKFLLSYNDLEEYAAKDSNRSITLLEAMEKAEGKSTTLAFCNNVLSNKSIVYSLLEKLKQKELEWSIKEAIVTGFDWSTAKEGFDFWNVVHKRSNRETLYNLTIKMIEDYAKHTNPKTITIDTMQKILKEPKMAMIAPFNKGSLNIKGIIHQAAKGIKDDRPFVVALIDEELERVKTLIKNNPRDTFNYEGYDIRINHLKNLILESKTTIETVEDFKITPLSAIRFYEFEKLIKKPLDCSWIKSYLTQENMQKPLVSLFKSNKMSIKLENGLVSMTNLKDKRTYGTPVLYDKTKNEFYL